ncbi:MAG: sigma-70 family RNA polymerase sigma factor [Planctomycetes bacterium]|nr:sigma-70 family RNA polymerase sigma factor [Planctomycetota bacterium]MCW8136029.1 sigma-70 family RNA polymerase sigma factor [Planctomycetota bacterium]
MQSKAEHLKVLATHAPALTERGWRLAWSLLRHRQEAEDVVQEAFQVAAHKIAQLPTDDPWPWFGTVVAKLARNAIRKRARRASRTSDDQELLVTIPDRDPNPALDAQRRELSQRLTRELENLPEDERDALVLTHIGGLTFRQAAEAMGMPEGSFPHCVRRGTDRLRKALGVSQDRTGLLIAALPVPAVPAGLKSSVAALLSGAATSATSKTLTGAVMIKIAMLAVPFVLMGTLAHQLLEDPQPQTTTLSHELPATPAQAPQLPGPEQATKAPEAASPNAVTGHEAAPDANKAAAEGDQAGDGESADTQFGGKAGDRPAADGGKTDSAKEKPVEQKPEAEKPAEKPAKDPGSIGQAGELGSLGPWDAGSYIHAHVFSPDGRAVFAGGDTLLSRFDAATGKRIWSAEVGDCPIEHLAVSPDSLWIYTSGPGSAETDSDHNSAKARKNTAGAHICIWNAQSGALVGKFPNSGPGYVLAVTPDGKQLVGAGYQGFSVWDIATRRYLRTIEYTAAHDQEGLREPAAFRVSNDGKRIVACFEGGGSNTHICAWEFQSGKLLHHWRFEQADEDAAPSGKFVDLAAALGVSEFFMHLEDCAISPDGKFVVCTFDGGGMLADGDGDGTSDDAIAGATFTLDVATGAVRAILRHPVEALALSQDGKTAVAVIHSFNPEAMTVNRVITWNPQTGKVATRADGDFDGEAMRISPDGKLAALRTQTRLVVFAVSSGELRAEEDDRPGPAVDGTGKTLGTARHKDSIHSIEYSPDGKSLLSADVEGRIVHWDVAKGTAICTISQADRLGPNIRIDGPWFGDPALFSSDGSLIICMNSFAQANDGAIQVWDARRGKRVSTFASHERTGAIYAYASAKDLNRLVVLTAALGIVVYDINTGKELHVVANPPEFKPAVRAKIAISGDGMLAWVVSGDTLVKFDASLGTSIVLANNVTGPQQTVVAYSIKDATYEVLQECEREQANPVSCMRLAPDGRRLLLAFQQYTGILLELDANSGAELRRIDCNPPVLKALPKHTPGATREEARQRSDDLRRIIDENQKLVETHKRNYVVFSRFALSPDGKHALVPGYNNMVHLLDIESGHVVANFKGHKDMPSAVAVSPDGTQGVTGGEDKLLRKWDLKVSPAPRNPTTGK